MNEEYGVKDIESFSTGVLEWTGVTYEWNDIPIAVLQGRGNGGKVIQIQSSGFAPDSDQTKAVCASIGAKGVGEE